MTEYPTLETVETADAVALLRWYRFLPSPGASASGHPDAQVFNEVVQQECAILTRIKERLETLGGITPSISKAVGWDESPYCEDA